MPKNETARRNFMNEKEIAGVDKAMKAMTKGDGDGMMYTESYYNTNANDKERKGYDKEAHKIMYSMYAKDKSEGKFQELSFDQYLNVVNNAWFDEVSTYAKESDPDFYSQAGALLSDTYGGDVDQFKLSAKNYLSKTKDRGNVSIKAPQAEQY